MESVYALRRRGSCRLDPRAVYRETEGRSRFEVSAQRMPKLPKSFLSRLRAQTPATVDLAPHPDADTLTAFAERALPAPERASVALHLAACADCRATLELAFGADALPAPATAPGRWSGAHLWRFLIPALAAGLVLVFVLPSLHRTEPVRIAAMRPLPRPEPLPGPAASVPTPTAPAAPVREPARARASSPPVALFAERPPLPSLPSPSAGLTAQTELMASKLIQSQALAAAPPPPPPPATASSHSESVEVFAAEKSIVPVQQAPAPSQGEAPAAAQGGQSGQTRLRTNAEIVAGQSQAPPATTYFAPSVAAAQDRLARQKVSALQASTAEVTQTASAAPAQQWNAALPEPAARWEICRLVDHRHLVHGNVCQVSADGTRRAVAIDPSVELLAVASQGAEVWAGGAAGALYSSTDNGLHWQRSVVSATAPGQNQDATLTKPIVAIDLSVPGQVRIATSTGETWILRDGLWRRKTD
jgi:hypothetical protein